MENSKFILDGPAFEGSTRQVIQPHHVMPIHEEAGVGTQIFQTPPGLPTLLELRDQPGDAPENSLLKWMMEDACDQLHGFQEYEHYSFDLDSGSDCDVPEDEFTDEIEDISSDENQLVPVSLPEDEGPSEGDHGQQSPGNIPVDYTIALEENIEPSVVNLHVTLVDVQVKEPEESSTPRRLDEMENIIAIEEDQLVPVNSQEVEHFTEGDRDQSSPVIIPVGDTCSEEDELISVNLQEEEDPTGQGDHDQPSPVIPPVEDIIAIEGNETCPMNLHGTEENVQEHEDPSAPRRLDFNNATFVSVYSEEDQEVIPEIQLQEGSPAL